ncbi:MAG: hypothetical protein A2452_09055 [Candidatus Firestonebacteria bacterium RIFOXYC2_FULL_39_67]|nr:MAG: hypothetical protein A2536_04145 [Candidatus Firestonebacteria bacterium RIFOXYD2_FULL_39_29]OGF56433.1 MAG: hypothetical protein A2452_09055 [Candidatus Firestonebacteria bacterium RIFOXYC2_FULL_39_67]OGF57773.1 MAG: hypothetical protein A2497_01270 [Candidatus Firestonebacteria bacterium RifOxyC12_full_39_7]
MRLKLLACEVFHREISHFISKSKNIVDVEFLEKGLHDKSDILRKKLQEKIDEISSGKIKYEAIALAYGLCGNSSAGVKAGNVPVVIPRVHDCAGFLLGSNKRYMEHFKDNLSQPFTSAGYMERGDSMFREGESDMKVAGTQGTYDDFVKMYGEENAKFIMESLNPKKHNDSIVYIETEITKHLGYAEKTKELARKENLKYVEYQADLRLLQDLVDGNWSDTERFLVVPPGKEIKPSYDEFVIKT